MATRDVKRYLTTTKEKIVCILSIHLQTLDTWYPCKNCTYTWYPMAYSMLGPWSEGGSMSSTPKRSRKYNLELVELVKHAKPWSDLELAEITERLGDRLESGRWRESVAQERQDTNRTVIKV